MYSPLRLEEPETETPLFTLWAKSDHKKAHVWHAVKERIRFSWFPEGKWTTKWHCGNSATSNVIMGDPERGETCIKCFTAVATRNLKA